MHLKTMGGRRESEVYLRKRRVRLRMMSDKRWVRASAFEEHRVQRPLPLWLCDFITSLSVFVAAKVSHKQLLKYFILVTSETHNRYWFKNRTIFSSFFFWATIYQLSTVIQPHVWRAARHCQVSHTLSILTQPRGKKAGKEKDGEIWPLQFSIFSFLRKRGTRKRGFQEQLLVRVPVVHVCTRTHARTQSHSFPQCFENIHKCPE